MHPPMSGRDARTGSDRASPVGSPHLTNSVSESDPRVTTATSSYLNVEAALGYHSIFGAKNSSEDKQARKTSKQNGTKGSRIHDQVNYSSRRDNEMFAQSPLTPLSGR